MSCCKFDLSRHRFRYPGSSSANKDLDIVGPVDLAIQGHEFDEEFQYCPISGSRKVSKCRYARDCAYYYLSLFLALISSMP